MPVLFLSRAPHSFSMVCDLCHRITQSTIDDCIFFLFYLKVNIFVTLYINITNFRNCDYFLSNRNKFCESVRNQKQSPFVFGQKKIHSNFLPPVISSMICLILFIALFLMSEISKESHNHIFNVSQYLQ